MSYDTAPAETQARTPTDYKMVTGIEDMASIDETNETSNIKSSSTQTNSDNPKQPQPEELSQSIQSLKIKGPVQQTDDSTESSIETYTGYVKPRRPSIPQFSTVASTDSKPPAKNNDDKESKKANVSPTAVSYIE